MTNIEKIRVNDPETKSTDIVAGNIEALKELFPEVFTEGLIDFEALKGLLGAAVDERDEKYGLNWHGKRRARQIALTPSTGTLLPCPEESVDWDTTQNLMIEGDNLEVLKLLQKSYAGKVKLIYIDPPYNTGSDFVYPDDFRDNIKNYLQITGQINESGSKLSSNTELSGRFHTDWLNMMYPRIKNARNLLRNDGVIFLSVDDNEVHNLRKICNEIFGEENFIGQFVVNSSPSAIDYGHIAKMHDYVLFYAKNLLETTSGQLTEEGKVFKYNDDIGPFNIYPLYNGNVAFNPKTRPNLYYPFYLNPNSRIGQDFFEISLEKREDLIEVYPVISRKDGIQRVWRWGRDKARQDLNKEIVGYRTEEGSIESVQKARHTGKMIRSLQLDTEISTRRGTAQVEELFGEKLFPFPKSVELVRRFIAVGTDPDSIVIDFFAGSGTTGQAVWSQNAIDQGKRRFILVQFPEQLNPEIAEQELAADYCDKLGVPRTIAELTKDRLRKSAKKIAAENPLFVRDMGFRTFKLASSNIRVWEPDAADLESSLLQNAEHLVQGRTEQDVLFELLLKLGLDLCEPTERKTIAGKIVHSIGGGALIVCLADGLTKDVIEPLASGMVAWWATLAPAVDTRVVFKDSGFADDIAKTNMAAILNQNGISDVSSL